MTEVRHASRYTQDVVRLAQGLNAVAKSNDTEAAGAMVAAVERSLRKVKGVLKNGDSTTASSVQPHYFVCPDSHCQSDPGSCKFKVFGVDWRAYGQTAAQGSRLMDIILPGNQTGSS